MAGLRLLEGEFSAEADKSFIERDPLVIILDCSTEDRPGTPFIPLKGLKRIVIDHHSSGVPFAEDGMSYIVPESPSTTLLVDTVRIALGVELTERMAGYLYRGFATDTGFYHFLTERTAPESLRKAAAFTEAGVSPYDVYDEMQDGRKLNRKTAPALPATPKVFCHSAHREEKAWKTLWCVKRSKNPIRWVWEALPGSGTFCGRIGTPGGSRP